VRPETHLYVRAEKGVNEMHQGALEVGEGNALVHEEPFHLNKHGTVRRIQVHPVYASGRHNGHRRRGPLHDAYLNRRRLRAQHDSGLHEERVMRIPGRMVIGCIQRIKIIILRFHIRAERHLESHLRKNGDEFFHDLIDYMYMAAGDTPSREAQVRALLPRLVPLHRRIEFCLARFQRCRHRILKCISLLADFLALFRRRLGKAPHNLRHMALASQKSDPDLFQRLQGFGGGNPGEGLFA